MISKELFSYSKDMLKRGEPVESVKKLVGDMGRWTSEDIDNAVEAILKDTEEAKSEGRDPKTPAELLVQVESMPKVPADNPVGGVSDTDVPKEGKKCTKRKVIMLGVVVLVIIAAIFVMKGVMDNNEDGVEQDAIRTAMFSVLPESTLYYDTHVGGYNPDAVESNDCTADFFGYGSLVAVIRDIEKIAQNPVTCKIAIDGESWSMSALLKDTSLSYCWLADVNISDSGTFHESSIASGGGSEPATCE